MLMVISPAKTLDFDTPPTIKRATEPQLVDDSALLIKQLKGMAPQDIASLMKLSDKLAELNYDRYQQWSYPFDETAKQAVLAFKGDVYTGLAADTLSADELGYAQQHLRILSGLYGLLRPLDKILPYRLEMGTKLANTRGKNLYDFWGEKITQQLNQQLKKLKSSTLINLASNEYFSSIQKNQLDADVITPVFKDYKSGKYKIISFYAKKARGMMSAYAIRENITLADPLKSFTMGGYAFNEHESNDQEWVFLRKSAE